MARTRTLRTLPSGQQVVGDLGAQLARGDHDEGLRGVGQLLGLGAAGLDVGGDGDALQEREAEAQRLAGAGLGLADDVRAGKGYGERHLLDREGETIPTASRASAVSGRIPSSRKVVRVLPLLCARCEASAGVVSGPCRGRRLPYGQPVRASRTARDHCRRSSARTAEGPPPNDVRNVPYGRGGLSGRSRSGHRPGILIRAARRILGGRITTIPRNHAHALADLVT